MTGFRGNQMRKTADEMVKELILVYKDDEEAMELINSAKADISYLIEREKETDYKGQTAEGKVEEIKDVLRVWY